METVIPVPLYFPEWPQAILLESSQETFFSSNYVFGIKFLIL